MTIEDPIADPSQDELLHVEAGHDRLAGARVVGEQEPEPRLAQEVSRRRPRAGAAAAGCSRRRRRPCRTRRRSDPARLDAEPELHRIAIEPAALPSVSTSSTPRALTPQGRASRSRSGPSKKNFQNGPGVIATTSTMSRRPGSRMRRAGCQAIDIDQGVSPSEDVRIHFLLASPLAHPTVLRRRHDVSRRSALFILLDQSCSIELRRLTAGPRPAQNRATSAEGPRPTPRNARTPAGVASLLQLAAEVTSQCKPVYVAQEVGEGRANRAPHARTSSLRRSTVDREQ